MLSSLCSLTNTARLAVYPDISPEYIQAQGAGNLKTLLSPSQPRQGMLEWAERGGQMGTFRVEVTVRNLQDPVRTRTLSLLVDTGATYTTLPRDVVEAVGCHPIGKRRVLLANGREEEWPVGAVSLTLEGQELPTVCLIGPNGGPALLGAVTLEEFALGVDPVAKRLIPVRSYLT